MYSRLCLSAIQSIATDIVRLRYELTFVSGRLDDEDDNDDDRDGDDAAGDDAEATDGLLVALLPANERELADVTRLRGLCDDEERGRLAPPPPPPIIPALPS